MVVVQAADDAEAARVQSFLLEAGAVKQALSPPRPANLAVSSPLPSTACRLCLLLVSVWHAACWRPPLPDWPPELPPPGFDWHLEPEPD